MEKEESVTQQSSNHPYNPVETVQPNEIQDGHVSQCKDQAGGVQSMYCKELVSGGDSEFSFEELRAQGYFKQLNEKVLHMGKVKEELQVQIEQKEKLIQERVSVAQNQKAEEEPHHPLLTAEGTCAPVVPKKTSPLQIYSEPEMPSSSIMRNTLASHDEDLGQGGSALNRSCSQAPKLFTLYDENNLSEKPNTRSSSRSHTTLKLPTSILKARQPASECVSDKDVSISRSEEAIINGHLNKTLCKSPDDTCDFVRAAQMASTPFGGPVKQNPAERVQMEDNEPLNKTSSIIFKEPISDTIAETKKLSPIHEISHEWGYTSCSMEPESQARSSSHPEMSQYTRRTESAVALEADPVNPVSLEVRRALLENVDLSSFANFYKKAGPLPEAHGDLQLDGEELFFLKKMADQDIYWYWSNGGNALIKVDRSSVPWDFYISSQLRARLSADLQHCHAQSTCYLYERGSFTLWRVPQGQTLQDLVENHVNRQDVPHLAIQLMEMVKQMHSCHLVHGSLRPETLLVCHSCEDSVVTGIDFSSSLDLKLQTEVKMAQAFCPAQDYIRQGLLLPSASPYQVDLCGIAEIVYLLLVGRNMELVKEGSYWRLADESKTHLSDPLWDGFFHNILNPEDNPTESVLSNLISNLKNALFEGPFPL